MKFFHTMHTYKMESIFHFFHNGQDQYSISVDTQKTRDSNLGGGVSTLKFVCIMHIYKIAAICDCFIMAETNIPFPLTLRKPETQNFGGLAI